MTCGMSCVGLFLLTTDKYRPSANGNAMRNAHENAQENAHVERYKSAQENATRMHKENRPPRPCFRGGLLTRMRSPELKDVLSEDV